MAKKDDRLTVEDLVFIIQMEFEIPPQTHERLARWILASPHLVPELRELRRLVEDAGLDPTTREGIWAGFWANEELDRLLPAEWSHPAEVLDPEAEGAEIAYPELIAIAESRAERARGAEKMRLLEVASRLRDSCEPQLHIQRLTEGLRKAPPKLSRMLARLILDTLEGASRAACRPDPA